MRIQRLLRRREIVCQELVELVTAYLEGTLTAREHARLERHLAACDGCSAYLEQLRVTIRLTGRLDHASLPAEMQERLLNAFREWKRG